MEFSGNNNNRSQNNSGLLRYKSDPTSLLANLTNMTSSGISCDVINTVDVMKKGDNSCNKAMNSQLPPKYTRKNGGQSYVKPVNYYSAGIDYESHGKISSSLVRQNSSPAGLFPQLNPQSGYMGSKFDYETNGSSFTSFGSWSNSYSCDAEDFFKSDELDRDRAPFVDHFQIEEHGDSHNLLSVPKTAAHEKTDAKKKLLHFEDTVPCKVRAKRGCATHPRSIAERVRRTRISERMRKLQDIVPNMDKQTTTAKMLDFAVEYIKDLQKQYKALIEIRANCKCLASEKVNLNEAL
ncbi:basic helix-loop-helix (bHLH) DNA-bindingsuperfamily protein [Striga asiatica]|uniref:Basic helix-loop-helix (BHLH) DNA-bindingsuperfamily protein n=1 Tax=Striga asiatica TaxID=4170 RepID=A0A5A7NZE3_STRAF|nr:basic helix-loop-helix (bHLH) DNA-bindingsuperfamily protein [Striga asiatica]